MDSRNVLSCILFFLGLFIWISATFQILSDALQIVMNSGEFALSMRIIVFTPLVISILITIAFYLAVLSNEKKPQYKGAKVLYMVKKDQKQEQS